jgi:hypothetical protein
MFLAILIQSLVIAVALAGCWVWMGVVAVQAFAYGSIVALVNSGMLVGRWYSGLNDYHCSGERHLKSFHRSMLERFFVVGVLLAVGFSVLNLPQFVMLSGFIVGQLAWVASIVLTRRLF